LEGAPAFLDLLPDRPRGPRATYAGARLGFVVNEGLTHELERLSAARGTTLYMTLLGAFYVLLGRWSGDTDVVVGSAAANRERAEFEPLVGLFVNALPMRGDLSGNPTFVEVMRRVREMALGAYAHQQLPFEKLVKELRPPRDMRRPPLFQVMFDMQNAPMPVAQSGGLRVSSVEAPLGIAKYELTLSLTPSGRMLGGTLEYNTELFESVRAEQMVEQYVRILEQIVQAPEASIASLRLLSAEQEEHIARGWNATQRAAALRTVLEQFEEQAVQTPTAPAVKSEEQTLSYAELALQASRLGSRLRELGVGAEVRVGLLAQRTPAMVVGLLGIWKAGGACVPLDVNYPTERLRWMMQDAGLALVLTTAGSAAALPVDGALLIDIDEAVAEARDAGPSLEPVNDEQAAYIMYTSGSTGRPKGVLIAQKSLANYVTWASEAYEVEPRTGAPLHTSLGFDLTWTSLLCPLVRGECVQLVADGDGVDGLQEALGEGGKSVLKLTPAHLQMLAVGPLGRRTEGPARSIVVGGEALHHEMIQSLLERWSGSRVYNEYGPTETVVGCCVHEVKLTCRETPGPVPIGRPIANTKMYVMDSAMKVVPPGVKGEIYVGGVQVARGHIERADLTAERFAPDPYGASGERIYRTGDFGRYHLDGNLEYLGRRDGQVKLRGYRVEVGEVEAALERLSGVARAAASVQDVGGQRQLIGDVTAGRGGPPSPLARPARELPAHMIPWTVVVLPDLPMSAHGKVDRQRLPAPERQERSAEEPPRDPLELRLSELVSEVLALPRVGVHQSFFDLGGHSLSATQLLGRIRLALGVEMPLRTIFEGPTVAQIAEQVRLLRDGGTAPLAPIQRVGRDRALPLSFAQQRLWILEQLDPGQPTYNVSTVLRLRGALDSEAFQEAL